MRRRSAAHGVDNSSQVLVLDRAALLQFKVLLLREVNRIQRLSAHGV